MTKLWENFVYSFWNFLSCEAAIGIVVEILFCLDFEEFGLTKLDAKKIVTDSPTRAMDKLGEGIAQIIP